MPANEDALWTVVSLQQGLYALPVEHVQTMVMLPQLTKVPRMPDWVRGVFVLRGATVPVIDLRTRLGMPSLEAETEELTAMLLQREADHRNWVDELERSVQERRVFALTTDPHECLFGRWYDTFETDNLLLQSLLKKFDSPHRAIHAIAEEVLGLEKSGDSEGAHALIARTREGELAEMLMLFESLRLQIRQSNREIAVVLTVGDRDVAVAVDSVETVSRVSECDAADDITATGIAPTEAGLLGTIGKLDKSGRLVITLETAGLLPDGTVDVVA
jgi:purine-binding chemotaxis protein CheW